MLYRLMGKLNIKVGFLYLVQMLIFFWGNFTFELLIAQEGKGEGTNTDTGNEVEILSDKVYVYGSFNVLFKTPFQLEENVIIRPGEPSEQDSVLRTDKLNYTSYQIKNGKNSLKNFGHLEGSENTKSERLRAFIIGFYTVKSGIQQLPRLHFESIKSRQIWESPAISFASFQVDESSLPLPVDIELNPLPNKVYLGQNIVFNTSAGYVTAIDQSFLLQLPEFSGFLARKSPIRPEVESLKILGHDAYRLSLGTWLLNPIQEGILEIPSIFAMIMGLERQTLPYRLEVLRLPLNPYRPELVSNQAEEYVPAIGQFELSFRFIASKDSQKLGASKNNYQLQRNGDEVSGGNVPNEIFHLAPSAEFARDEQIRVALRISGSGNIHLFSFPEVRFPSTWSLLQSNENEAIEVDFAKAELSGWREKTFVYQPNSFGNYRLSVEDFEFFNPKHGSWERLQSKGLEAQVMNQMAHSYYVNLDRLHFSSWTVFFFNVMFLLQEYAFYFCLIVFLLGSAIIVPKVIRYSLLDKKESPQTVQNYFRFSYYGIMLLLLLLLLLWLLDKFLFSSSILEKKMPTNSLDLLVERFFEDVNLGPSQEMVMENYEQSIYRKNINAVNAKKHIEDNIDWPNIKEQLKFASYFPGHLLNISLWFYQNGFPQEALQVAYVSYKLLPLHPVAHRLVLSLRIQQGLPSDLPTFFVWPLKLSHIWKFVLIILFVLISIRIVRQNEYKVAQEEALSYHYSMVRTLKYKLLNKYRNYFVIVVLLLYGLSISWRFMLAVNTRADKELATIPFEAVSESKMEDRRRHWQNRLAVGELVKIKGRIRDSRGSSSLVIGENENQGWLDEKELFWLF